MGWRSCSVPKVKKWLADKSDDIFLVFWLVLFSGAIITQLGIGMFFFTVLLLIVFSIMDDENMKLRYGRRHHR